MAQFTSVLVEERPAGDSPPCASRRIGGVGRGRRFGWCVLALLLFGAHLPLVVWFADHLWQRPYYRHALLVVPLAVAMAGRRVWEEGRTADGGRAWRPGDSRTTRRLFVVALLTTVVASYLWSRWPNLLAMTLTGVAILHAIGGWRLPRVVAPWMVVVAVAIPPPLEWDDRLMSVMRDVAVRGAGGALDLLGVLHQRTGLLIELPGKQLLIEEACSGINSLMAVLGLTVFLGVWSRKSPRRIVGLLAVAIFLVVVLNIVRIAGGAWLYAARGVDVLSGTAHGMSSAVLFGLCLGLLASADCLFDWIFGVPEDRAEFALPPPKTVAGTGAAAARIHPWLWALAVVYLMCGLLQVRQGYVAGYWQSRWSRRTPTCDPSKLHLPSHLAEGWTQVQSGERATAHLQTVGTQSRRWYFRDDTAGGAGAGQLTVAIAIDYPFRGYHDLTHCYVNGGWTIGPREGGGSTRAGEAFDVYTLSAAPLNGLLCFSLLDAGGEWISPAAHRGEDSLAGRLRGPLPGWWQPSYQVQAFVPTYATLSEAERGRVQALFLEARGMLREQVVHEAAAR